VLTTSWYQRNNIPFEWPVRDTQSGCAGERYNFITFRTSGLSLNRGLIEEASVDGRRALRDATGLFALCSLHVSLQPLPPRRFAVRTSAAARDAFFARAERPSGVIFRADVLFPIAKAERSRRRGDRRSRLGAPENT
jgi:hypothetical protein